MYVTVVFFETTREALLPRRSTRRGALSLSLALFFSLSLYLSLSVFFLCSARDLAVTVTVNVSAFYDSRLKGKKKIVRHS